MYSYLCEQVIILQVDQDHALSPSWTLSSTVLSTFYTPHSLLLSYFSFDLGGFYACCKALYTNTGRMKPTRKLVNVFFLPTRTILAKSGLDGLDGLGGLGKLLRFIIGDSIVKIPRRNVLHPIPSRDIGVVSKQWAVENPCVSLEVAYGTVYEDSVYELTL